MHWLICSSNFEQTRKACQVPSLSTLFVPPFPPWMTLILTPALPSLGTLGSLLQHSGLPSPLCSTTPHSTLPATAQPHSRLPNWLGSPHLARHSSAAQDPFPALPSLFCLSVLSTPARSPSLQESNGEHRFLPMINISNWTINNYIKQNLTRREVPLRCNNDEHDKSCQTN